MRLAIIRQRYNPYGGAKRFIERALAALVSQGTQVTLIARSWEGASQASFEKIICDPQPGGVFGGRTELDRAVVRCVQHTIAECNFDLVQSHERLPRCSIFRAGDGVHAVWLTHRTPTHSPGQRFAQKISSYHRYLLATENSLSCSYNSRFSS